VQTPTHLKAGILIDRTVSDRTTGPIRNLAIGLLGVYSHVFLDAISTLTYHPPDRMPGWFWFWYHAGLSVLSLKIWKQNQAKHRLAMICSLLPDLDWLVIKIPSLVGIRVHFWRRPLIHEMLFKTLFWLPPMRLLNHLPNLRRIRKAAILELFAYLLLSRSSLQPGHQQPR